MAEPEHDGALTEAGEGRLCPCGEPEDANGDCPGSWHGCEWHNEGPEDELEAG
jgi:hypothetical protein